MTILAVFRSRSQSLDYAERLHKYGVNATTVSTPKEANIGCGLCVQFEARFFARANSILKTAKYSAFKGFYKLDFVGGPISLIAYRPQ